MPKLMFVFLVAILTSCSGPKEVEKVEKDEIVEKPVREMTPDEVAECPCGRADWSEPPPGFEKEKPKSDR